jgi:hypothetical protein
MRLKYTELLFYPLFCMGVKGGLSYWEETWAEGVWEYGAEEDI